MWNGTRFYIGEILDVYKKGASSRYGSIEDSPTASGLSYLSLCVYLPLGNVNDLDDDLDADEIPAPLFSCYDKSAHIYTHAKVEHLIFHLGPNILEASDRGGLYQTLTKHAALRWNMLTKKESVVKEIRKVILKVKKP
ncbi:hypothetical protein B0H14DRAFT_3693536 [Mycena olivaceomarginata]|nr:hypothetical protein B0H14DRAFT_3693536 [Mycena olivaceomarginata]